jgi:hypothetical protein
VLRVLQAPLHPFDWTRTTAEFRETLDRYERAAGDRFEFAPARTALDDLDAALTAFYERGPARGTARTAAVRRFNRAQRRLARLLVPVNYSRMPAFWHDPAVNVPPLPDLAPALSASWASGNPAHEGVLRAHLVRGRNRLAWALEQAREAVEA